MVANPWWWTARFLRRRRMSEGLSVIDVPDLDAAIAIVKEWPSLQYPGVAVEVRPILDHFGGM